MKNLIFLLIIAISIFDSCNNDDSNPVIKKESVNGFAQKGHLSMAQVFQ
jgi:hypothetical protein